MSSYDPVSDTVCRLMNASRAKHATVTIPLSRMSEAILNVLLEEGFIGKIDKVQPPQGYGGTLTAHLKYGPMGLSSLAEGKVISRRGRRVYCKCDAIPRPLSGMGISIVSTSRGVLSDRKCREYNVGGEPLCQFS